MNFSDRTPKDLGSNPIAAALERFKPSELIDLTVSNPTRCGLEYPDDLLKELASPKNLTYTPEPLGLQRTREQLAEYLSKKGQPVDPGRLVLTASTSEAYSYLFKLLGNAGDSFLVPDPGYPLLEHLAALDAIVLHHYHHKAQPGWALDLSSVEKAPLARSKGLISVNPNNPTGGVLHGPELEGVLASCKARGMAYISDEVFSEYIFDGSTPGPIDREVLSFRLGGFSKSLGLPQLKLSWMEVDGPKNEVQECLDRLGIIADAYLSVSTPVQTAAGSLLTFADPVQKQIRERVQANFRNFNEMLSGLSGVRVWPLQAGWYALLELKNGRMNDDQVALGLIEKHRTTVHPGCFYDFPQGQWLVVSLLPQPPLFQEGVSRLKSYLKNF